MIVKRGCLVGNLIGEVACVKLTGEYFVIYLCRPLRVSVCRCEFLVCLLDNVYCLGARCLLSVRLRGLLFCEWCGLLLLLGLAATSLVFLLRDTSFLGSFVF